MRVQRVAITSNTLAPGGAERQRVLLANGLSERGIQVALVLLQGRGSLIEDVSPSVRIVEQKYYSGGSDAFDIVITGTTNTEVFFGLRSKLSGTPWIVAIHNPTGVGAPGLKRFSLSAIRFSDARIALSDWHKKRVERDWGLKVTHTISNGVDPARFACIRSQRASNTWQASHDFGFLGRISMEHKGLDLLVDMLSLLPERRLLIGGDGPDLRMLQDRAQKTTVRHQIDWIGECRPEEVLSRVSVMVMPSRFEGLPMVGLESVAAGVPIVASEMAGLSDIRGVYSFPMRDCKSLANACEEVLQGSPKLGRRLSEVSVPTVGTMVDEYLKVIDSVPR